MYSLQNIRNSGLLMEWFTKAYNKIKTLARTKFKTTAMSNADTIQAYNINVKQLMSSFILYIVLNVFSLTILFVEIVVFKYNVANRYVVT